MTQRELSYQKCKELEIHARNRNKSCLYPLSANDVYVRHGSAYTSYICYLKNCGNSVTGCSNETTWLPSYILR